MYNLKLSGQNYETSSSKDYTVQDCVNNCNKQPRCVGWDYNLGTNTCNLYDNVNLTASNVRFDPTYYGNVKIPSIEYSSPTHIQSLISNMQKSPQMPINNYSNQNSRVIAPLTNMYCSGPDAKYYKSTSPNNCRDTCLESPSCYAYTVENNDPNSCTLINGNPTCIYREGVTSGFIPTPTSHVTIQSELLPSPPVLPTNYLPRTSTHHTLPPIVPVSYLTPAPAYHIPQSYYNNSAPAYANISRLNRKS